MKIVKFQGGLGNQLFQYVFLRNLEIIYQCDFVKGDFSYYYLAKDRDIYLREDGIKVPNIEKLNVKILNINNLNIKRALFFKKHQYYFRLKYFFQKMFFQYYCEPNRRYQEIKKILDYKYFDGVWASWRYVSNVEKELRNELMYRGQFNNKTKTIINQLSKENAVFIGIRRGDYLENEANKKHFGNFSSDYYNKAIHYIKERVKNPVFYIFSDDIPWVKENMNFEVPVNYREKEDQTNDVEELFIMGACKHAIIVNSTFQWWGAWLIDNKDKIVIAPDPWFNDGSPIDIIPPEWHQMERC